MMVQVSRLTLVLLISVYLGTCIAYYETDSCSKVCGNGIAAMIDGVCICETQENEGLGVVITWFSGDTANLEESPDIHSANDPSHVYPKSSTDSSSEGESLLWLETLPPPPTSKDTPTTELPPPPTSKDTPTTELPPPPTSKDTPTTDSPLGKGAILLPTFISTPDVSEIVETGGYENDAIPTETDDDNILLTDYQENKSNLQGPPTPPPTFINIILHTTDGTESQIKETSKLEEDKTDANALSSPIPTENIFGTTKVAVDEIIATTGFTRKPYYSTTLNLQGTNTDPHPPGVTSMKEISFPSVSLPALRAETTASASQSPTEEKGNVYESATYLNGVRGTQISPHDTLDSTYRTDEWDRVPISTTESTIIENTKAVEKIDNLEDGLNYTQDSWNKTEELDRIPTNESIDIENSTDAYNISNLVSDLNYTQDFWYSSEDFERITIPINESIDFENSTDAYNISSLEDDSNHTQDFWHGSEDFGRITIPMNESIDIENTTDAYNIGHMEESENETQGFWYKSNAWEKIRSPTNQSSSHEISTDDMGIDSEIYDMGIDSEIYGMGIDSEIYDMGIDSEIYGMGIDSEISKYKPNEWARLPMSMNELSSVENSTDEYNVDNQDEAYNGTLDSSYESNEWDSRTENIAAMYNTGSKESAQNDTSESWQNPTEWARISVSTNEAPSIESPTGGYDIDNAEDMKNYPQVSWYNPKKIDKITIPLTRFNSNDAKDVLYNPENLDRNPFFMAQAVSKNKGIQSETGEYDTSSVEEVQSDIHSSWYKANDWKIIAIPAIESSSSERTQDEHIIKDGVKTGIHGSWYTPNGWSRFLIPTS